FLFSSRRRHTRSKRDWSSDVCSSDLQALGKRLAAIFPDAGGSESAAVRETAIEAVDVDTLLDGIAEHDVLALDSDARFELGHGDARILAVSAEPARAWVVDLAEAGETAIARLNSALAARSLILHSAKLQIKAWESVGL